MVKIIKSFVRARVVGDAIVGQEMLGENLTYIYAIVLAAAPYAGIFMLLSFFECLYFLSNRIFYLVLLFIASVISFVLKRKGFYAQTKKEVENMSMEDKKKYSKKNIVIAMLACSMYIVPVAIIIVHALLTQ